MPAIRSTSRRCLIIELDGPTIEVDELIKRVETIAHGLRFGDLPDLQQRGRAQSVLGRPQGGFPRGRAHLAGLSLHGRHHSARRAAEGADAHPRAVGEIRARRAPTCSMPATAICIR